MDRAKLTTEIVDAVLMETLVDVARDGASLIDDTNLVRVLKDSTLFMDEAKFSMEKLMVAVVKDPRTLQVELLSVMTLAIQNGIRIGLRLAEIKELERLVHE